ncbi:MAG: hypothetical protein AAF665_04905 [Pseudomonadota bacterium]
MAENHWAIFALRDIKDALDRERYDVASYHIDDAIAAILSRDDQDGDSGFRSVSSIGSTLSKL